MNVYRILFGSLARYVRAENHAHARAIADNAWRKVSHRITDVADIGNYAPQSLGARGYDSAIACEERAIIHAQRAERKAQRVKYRAQQNAQRPEVNVASVFATL